MSTYQDPEVYVKQFIRKVSEGIEGLQLQEEMKVSYLRIKADYGDENIVIEAEPPCKRGRGKNQVVNYMKNFNRNLGILIDIPIEEYYSQYPNPCKDRVGFEIYRKFGNTYDVVYKKEFERLDIGKAKDAFRQLLELLKNKKLSLFSAVGQQTPTPQNLISSVKNLVNNYKKDLDMQLSENNERAKLYFNEWKNNISIIYGKEVIDSVGNLKELFIELTIYVAWLKALGFTLLESVLGGGKYSIPLQLYVDGSKAAVELFWEGRALTKFNINYLFERDEYDWIFDQTIAEKLDKFFKELGSLLLSYDWSKIEGLDLLKEIYQNVVPREVRRQLGEFYTPDWIAQLILWRALHILVKGSSPKEYIVEDPVKEAVELIDEFYTRNNRIPKLIDPTCGSFTFGVQYLNTLLKWYMEKKNVQLHPVKFEEQIARNVVGIDLNPVAVITARVNYLLQIYKLLMLYGNYLSTQPIIPVFRIDLLSIQIGESRKEEPLSALFVENNEASVHLNIPLEMLIISNEELTGLLKKLREEGLEITERTVLEDEKEIKIHVLQLGIPNVIYEKANGIVSLARSFIALLGSGVSGIMNELGSSLSQEEINKIEKFRKDVQVLENSGFDSLWYSILFNYMLVKYILMIEKEKFDLVLGNLPWVNISKYPKSYSALLKSVSKELGVSPPGRAERKIDISIPLFAISLKYLTSSPSITALMIPTSIFKGLHGSAWRGYINKTSHRVVEVWDLEEVLPFEGAKNQPGIVFIEKR